MYLAEVGRHEPFACSRGASPVTNLCEDMPIPRGAVRGISFDYGHVLAGLDLHELCERLREGPGGPPSLGTLRSAMPAAYRAHDDAIAAGLGHEGGWRALMATLVAAGGSHPEAADAQEAVQSLWRAQPMRNLWRDVPEEARALLAGLEHAGVPMVITSNSEGRVAELIAEVGLAHHFRAILDSGVLGYGKPETRIFALAAERLEIPLASMVHVGDSEAADIVGAHRAGAFAIRFDGFVPGAEARPTEADVRVSGFTELRVALGEALGLAS